MKHFWLGVILLAVLLFAGIGVGAFMDAVHLPVSEALENAAQEALSGTLDEAASTARDAHSRWQSHWRSTAAAADHAPMDEIDSLFAQLDIYAHTGQTAAFAACCAKLSALVHALSESHCLNWWNLL